MPKQEIFTQFFIVPKDSRWIADNNRYNAHQHSVNEAFRSLLCDLGYETREYQLYEKEIVIWPTGNDMNLYGRFLRKHFMTDGGRIVSHRSYLYKEWKRRKTKLGLTYQEPPKPEDYFAPAAGLTCQMTTMDSGTYLFVLARSPIWTEHFTGINGSDYYTAFRDLYLMLEASWEEQADCA